MAAWSCRSTAHGVVQVGPLGIAVSVRPDGASPSDPQADREHPPIGCLGDGVGPPALTDPALGVSGDQRANQNRIAQGRGCGRWVLEVGPASASRELAVSRARIRGATRRRDRNESDCTACRGTRRRPSRSTRHRGGLRPRGAARRNGSPDGYLRAGGRRSGL
jgi:hypothetical protein